LAREAVLEAGDADFASVVIGDVTRGAGEAAEVGGRSGVGGGGGRRRMFDGLRLRHFDSEGDQLSVSALAVSDKGQGVRGGVGGGEGKEVRSCGSGRGPLGGGGDVLEAAKAQPTVATWLGEGQGNGRRE